MVFTHQVVPSKVSQLLTTGIHCPCCTLHIYVVIHWCDSVWSFWVNANLCQLCYRLFIYVLPLVIQLYVAEWYIAFCVSWLSVFGNGVCGFQIWIWFHGRKKDRISVFRTIFRCPNTYYLWFVMSFHHTYSNYFKHT